MTLKQFWLATMTLMAAVACSQPGVLLELLMVAGNALTETLVALLEEWPGTPAVP